MKRAKKTPAQAEISEATNEQGRALTLVDAQRYREMMQKQTVGVKGLDFGTLFAARTPEGDTLVQVRDEKYGGVSVRLDPSGNMVNVLRMEHSFEGTNVVGRSWLNGEQIAEIEVNKSTYAIVHGWVLQGGRKVPVDQVQTQGVLRCLTDCLSNAGIPLYIILIVSSICGVICAGTAGVGCLPCVQGALIGAGSVGAFCIGYCF